MYGAPWAPDVVKALSPDVGNLGEMASPRNFANMARRGARQRISDIVLDIGRCWQPSVEIKQYVKQVSMSERPGNKQKKKNAKCELLPTSSRRTSAILALESRSGKKERTGVPSCCVQA